MNVFSFFGFWFYYLFFNFSLILDCSSFFLLIDLIFVLRFHFFFILFCFLHKIMFRIISLIFIDCCCSLLFQLMTIDVVLVEWNAHRHIYRIITIPIANQWWTKASMIVRHSLSLLLSLLLSAAKLVIIIV